jgi:hypothetical protein
MEPTGEVNQESRLVNSFSKKSSLKIWWVQKMFVPLHPQNDERRLQIDKLVP